MTRPAVPCARTTPLSEVVEFMRLQNCGFVPVVEQGTTQLVGIVTDRDVCLAAVARRQPLAQITAGAAMRTPVHSVGEDDDLAAVHETMRVYHVRRVPVVDAKGCLVGIVSLDDLARRAIIQGGVEVLREVGETLGRICMPRPLLPA